MPDAVVVDRKPIALDLEPGTYFWCACGRSSKHPFCDGSHKGTGLFPEKFERTEAGKVFLCQCKATGNRPFCDGSHRRVD